MRAILMSLFLAVVASAHPVAMQDPASHDWHVSGEEAVFIGDSTIKPISLPLLKRAFTNGPVTLTIESDAQDILLESEHTKVDLKPNRQSGTKLVLDGSDSTPRILLEGRSVEPMHGKWIQICMNPAETFTLQLPRGTFATIRFEGAQSASEPSKTSLPSAQKQSSSPVNLTATSMLESKKTSVFQITLKNEQGKTFASGTGFFVTNRGHALTNFHVVQGASSAEATINGRNIPLRIVALRPELDLAMVQLIDPIPGIEPLVIFTKAVIGEEVYALGYPLGLGYTVNKGVVNGIRRFRDLPKELQSATKYSPESQWIQTDCTINHGNSGGPLINSKGEVLGINTWSYTDANNAYFALVAEQAFSLVRSPPATEISFAEMNAKYKTAGAWFLFPTTLPVASVRQTSGADRIGTAAVALNRTFLHDCDMCNGHGTIGRSVATGYETRGLALGQTTYSEVRDPCPRCGGTGKVHGTPEAIDRAMKNLVSALGSTKSTDPNLSTKLPFAYAVLAGKLCLDPQTRQALAQGSSASMALSIKENTPIYLLGYVVAVNKESDSDEKRIVVMSAEGHRLAIVTCPKLSDNVIEGSAVLAAGIFAGNYDLGSQNASVLQDGFIIEDRGGHDLPLKP